METPLVLRFVTILLFALLLNIAAVASAATSPAVETDLRVDLRGRARAFCNGVQVILSIADYFEFFERQTLGGRARIAEGPWNGKLRENRPGKFTLSGIDPASGAAYTVVFERTDSSTIELTLRFTTPARPSNLGFDIAKLPSDIFLGAAIGARPAIIADAREVPISPRSMERRMLLTDKNRVLLRGSFVDLEISDLTENCSIYVADGRNLPWDKHKSLIVGVNRDSLAQATEYLFRYAIRCLPPTGVAAMARVALAGGAVAESDPWTFFALPPKQETRGQGVYRLRQEDIIVGYADGAAERQIAEVLRTRTGLDLAVTSATNAAPRRIVFEITPSGGLPAEGFELLITPKRVTIRGADARGCLYGAYALIARLQQRADGWELDCGTLQDWPDLPVRGICMELLKPPIRDVAMMKRYLDAVSRARGNTVTLLHLPQHIRAWREGRDDGNWTTKQMADIVSHARSLQIDVWAGMGSAFQPKDFPEMDIRPGTNLYNPFSEKAYAALFSLYDQILLAYQPSTLLISHDEIQGLNLYAAGTGKSTADIFAMDVRRVHAWLKSRQVRTAIWGDMLLDHETWESKVGSANSRNPAFNSGATHEALSGLPADILILDWHYQPKASYPSQDSFRRLGFPAIGATWHDPAAAKALAASVKRFGGRGIIATDWGIWPTLSPAATTLTALLCGWSSGCSSAEGGRDVAALAETLRPPAFSRRFGRQAPVDLAAMANAPTTAIEGGPGLFGLGPGLDLRALPVGPQVLGGVNFNPAPGAVVVVSGSPRTTAPPEAPLFNGRDRVSGIGFLHSCLVEEPQAEVRRLGRYLVTYESGRSAVIDLLDNYNITDIRSTEGLRQNAWSVVRNPDILIGARPAWRGLSAAGISINLQTLIWENPYPGETINSIRLSTSGGPPNSKIAVIGLTFLHN